MFSLDGSVKYWLYNKPVDMRKSFNGLSGIVTNGMVRSALDSPGIIFLFHLSQCFFTLLFVSGGMQRIHDVFKHALQLPLPEVIIDGLPRTELSREKSPLAACLVDVKDCVHDVTKRMFFLLFLVD